ncbi:4285_t:CDS:2 [Scutellospora calospora]|uniref:4285_t:CDS:1 n=1 Tax=Scutellospora calospora TaxID=85575 RepID=A0ACA9LVQ1_9GLOM|nr:4285_t:CDS:2 [Scutellospora calospora]
MHLLIPVNIQGNTMTPAAIRESAVDFKKEWIYAGADNEKQKKIRANKQNKHNNRKRRYLIRDEFEHHTVPLFLVLKGLENSNIALSEAQVIFQVVEDHDVDNPSDNYNINIDEDLYEEAHSYVELN